MWKIFCSDSPSLIGQGHWSRSPCCLRWSSAGTGPGVYHHVLQHLSCRWECPGRLELHDSQLTELNPISRSVGHNAKGLTAQLLSLNFIFLCLSFFKPWSNVILLPLSIVSCTLSAHATQITHFSRRPTWNKHLYRQQVGFTVTNHHKPVSLGASGYTLVLEVNSSNICRKTLEYLWYIIKLHLLANIWANTKKN